MGEAYISLTPAPFAFGIVYLSITLTTTFATQTQSLVVNIMNVNQPPTFTVPTTSLTYLEDVGAVTVHNFVTSISAGVGNEGALLGQNVFFTVDL